ncbi:MAG: hypothetical protein ACLP4W_30215 [Mycobacterium sp.]|uniref:hypothetical protein n=1 Tax=Mycobacterium sp. TaxID=1785 RepID=UPI003F9D7B99
MSLLARLVPPRGHSRRPGGPGRLTGSEWSISGAIDEVLVGVSRAASKDVRAACLANHAYVEIVDAYLYRLIRRPRSEGRPELLGVHMHTS